MAKHEFHGPTGRCHSCKKKVQGKAKLCDKCKKKRKQAWQNKYYKDWYKRSGGRVCSICKGKINHINKTKGGHAS